MVELFNCKGQLRTGRKKFKVYWYKVRQTGKLTILHRTKDSELLGQRYFLISINSELISNQKQNKPLKIIKQKPSLWQQIMVCVHLECCAEFSLTLSKENPLKLTETSAELIILQEQTLAIQYPSVKYNREFEGCLIFHRGSSSTC